MTPENERPSEEELADRLWRAITIIQAITDRLRAQHGKSLRERDGDARSLTSLRAV